MLLIWAFALAGLGLAPVAASAEEGAPVVVATTSIWADILDHLDCEDELEIVSLIPVGADSHAYEPSMRDRGVLTDAVLVVANGGGLEQQLADTLAAVADDGVPVLAVVDDDSDDPHVWLDPTLVVDALPALADALVTAGADPGAIDGCVAELSTALDDLDAELAGILAAVPEEQRTLVTNHDALGHFAGRYGFDILGTVVPGTSTLAEASPAELEKLAAEIEAAGVPAIFTEVSGSDDAAATLGERAGVDVVALYADSLGEPGSGAETYADMMRFNAHSIADALS